MKKLLFCFAFVLGIAAVSTSVCKDFKKDEFVLLNKQQTSAEQLTVNQNDSKNRSFQEENKPAESIRRQLTDAFAAGICMGIAVSVLIAMLIQGAVPYHYYHRPPSLFTFTLDLRP